MLQIELFLWIVLQLLHIAAPSPPPPNPVDFARDIRPILERRCQPCHFEGGKMYAKLPFDRAETIDGSARSYSRASKRMTNRR